MIEWLLSLLVGFAVVGIPLSLFLWVLCFARMQKGQPIIPWSPRRRVPWNLLDLIAILFIGLVVVSGSTQLISSTFDLNLAEMELEDLPPNQQMQLLIGGSVSSVAVLLLSLAFIRIRARANLADLGLSGGQIGQDLLLGLTGFIMLVVPMLAIQLTATFLIQTDERHPFIDVILQTPDIQFLAVITFAGIVVAPLAEEFLFRVILQGWLERVMMEFRSPPAPSCDSLPLNHAGELDSLGAAACSTESDLPIPLDTPVTPDPIPAERVTKNPVTAANCDDEDDAAEPQGPLWCFPILISGVMFGLAHLGQGPAPIALIFLGCGLGYIYQRTHRVLPCITVHFLVNLLAIAQLGLYIGQQANP
ncbi:MAG: CPBP family glutamic-type intramembrane protease [Pirellulaceae bacterium]|nr:CPBP family glutamic-type intramembrane protease [Pirellulaceae bacterium]